MSGRKSSEVANVLQQGEEARKQADESISRQIDEALRAFSAAVEQAQRDQKAALALAVELHPMAKDLFGAKAAEIAQQFQQVKDEAAGVTFGKSATRIRTELKKLDDELAEADAEGRAHSRIRNASSVWLAIAIRNTPTRRSSCSATRTCARSASALSRMPPWLRARRRIRSARNSRRRANACRG
jgi:hypothetical protein